jgi:hypothetical protein
MLKRNSRHLWALSLTGLEADELLLTYVRGYDDQVIPLAVSGDQMEILLFLFFWLMFGIVVGVPLAALLLRALLSRPVEQSRGSVQGPANQGDKAAAWDALGLTIVIVVLLLLLTAFTLGDVFYYRFSWPEQYRVYQ